MAIKDHNLKKNTNLPISCNPSLLLLSLCSFVSLFLVFSSLKGSTNNSVSSEEQKNLQHYFMNKENSVTQNLSPLYNYSNGSWVYDPKGKVTRYDNTCKAIFKGWNCISSNKSNARDISNWLWKPNDYSLPQFDPVQFLQQFRNTNIGFVGDSLNRNMFVSLVCTLKRVSKEVKKWRPAGADRGFTFLHYNLTVAYHRTNLLAHYGRWSACVNGGVLKGFGYKEGFRVDLDIPDGTWEEAPSFHDVLILNIGHWWWAPSKFDPIKFPMLFFEKGLPVIPPIKPEIGLDIVLKNMIFYVNRRMRPAGIRIFCTQSPRYFEEGDWDQGGSCQRVQPLLPEQVNRFFSLERNGTNAETRLANQHMYKVLEGSNFHILDVSHMSEFRADAHPSTAGGKKHSDCMHWCLPGITDTWNDLRVAYLNDT